MKLAALILLATLAAAQEMPRMTTWRLSVAALGVAQGLDIASSYGNVGREQNPLFGDTFTAKDAALKVGVVVAVVATQRLVIRKYPHSKAARVFSLVNFGVAGVTGVVAVRNWR
jgi:hypothetical protein